MNTRTAADLAPAYPRFGDFLKVRDQLDPDRIFANDYLDRVLGK
jgi:FAD/FMN-containing dehydrogenase